MARILCRQLYLYWTYTRCIRKIKLCTKANSTYNWYLFFYSHFISPFFFLRTKKYGKKYTGTLTQSKHMPYVPFCAPTYTKERDPPFNWRLFARNKIASANVSRYRGAPSAHTHTRTQTFIFIVISGINLTKQQFRTE